MCQSIQLIGIQRGQRKRKPEAAKDANFWFAYSACPLDTSATERKNTQHEVFTPAFLLIEKSIGKDCPATFRILVRLGFLRQASQPVLSEDPSKPKYDSRLDNKQQGIAGRVFPHVFPVKAMRLVGDCHVCPVKAMRRMVLIFLSWCKHGPILVAVKAVSYGPVQFILRDKVQLIYIKQGPGNSACVNPSTCRSSSGTNAQKHNNDRQAPRCKHKLTNHQPHRAHPASHGNHNFPNKLSNLTPEHCPEAQQ
mmetsp:Transcript_126721/g.246970  ORF Transcript_126721/g.246970 Transcript_126721/m.246970 type:complete len:251 (-) Transcript_126721:2-754(-)